MRNLCLCILFLSQALCLAQDSLSAQLEKGEQSSVEAGLAPENLQLSHIEIEEQFIDFKQLSDPAYRQKFAFGEALNESFDSIVAYYNYPVTMHLPHYLNTLTFHFAAIDWKTPHKIKYSYFLEGFEKDWSQPTTDAKAVFQSLPFGKYTLKIRAMGEQQVWSQPLNYHFSIRRPWWFSSWAYFVYASLLAGAGFVIFQVVERRKKEAAEFQRLLEENKLLAFSQAARIKPAPQEGGFLDLVNQILETHLSDENFGIAELCEILNISRAQLHRRLKSLTGQSTSHYIRSLRLDVARGLLQKTNLNVSEVAFTVGFSSATYFSKVFKEEFGYAPRESR